MDDRPDPLDWLEQERRQLGGSRTEFRQQLSDIDRMLIDVGDKVAGRIVPVTQAFLQADSHEASTTVSAAREVQHDCIRLEEACFVLLARQSPVAGDLRRVIAVLRSAGDVQRSANLLGHIADSLDWIHPPALPHDLRETIAQLGSSSSAIFGSAVDAWRNHDPLAASELGERDDQVDLLQKYLLTDLYTGEQSVEESVSLALIARYYERIGDHGVQMARQVTYFLTGDRLTDVG